MGVRQMRKNYVSKVPSYRTVPIWPEWPYYSVFQVIRYWLNLFIPLFTFASLKKYLQYLYQNIFSRVAPLNTDLYSGEIILESFNLSRLGEYL